MEVGGSKPLAPTIPGREGRARRLIPLLFVAVVVLLIAWAAWSAVTVFAAARDANDGRVAVERARDQSSPAEIVVGEPLPDLRAALEKFRAARGRIRHPVLAPMRIVPVLGRQIRSADALTAAANIVTETAIDAIEQGQKILQAPRGTGPQRVALLRNTAKLAADADTRIGRASLGPSNGLIGPLERARREFGEQIAALRSTLRNAAAAAGAGADLLAGPRRTLIFAANNAEMRAGSGSFLSVGELATADGRLDLGRMEPVGPVTVPKGVAVTGDLAARWGWANPSQDWTSLMLSPDFEASASLATRMWKAARGRTVDGVVSIDPVGVRALLQATGPVTVSGRRIDATNVVEELLHDQYERFPGAILSGGPRREFLGDIARVVMSRLDAGGWDPAVLMSGLADATRGRHVMIWSSRAPEQAAWRATGAAGRLSASSLMVALLNRGGNKLDWFMRVEADLSFVPTATGSQGVLRLTVRNTAPEGEPLYVQGPHPDSGGKAGEYLGILTVSLPGASGGGRIDGVEKLGVVGRDGPTRVVGTFFRLTRGRTRTFVVRFDLSVAAGAVRVEPSARIPATQWTFGSTRWADEEPRVVRWSTNES